jgi:hypothetical protein
MESQPSLSSPVHPDLAAQIVTPDIPMDAFLSQPNIPPDQAMPTYGGKTTPSIESFWRKLTLNISTRPNGIAHG